jgi:auxin efflux carrier family protein
MAAAMFMNSNSLPIALMQSLVVTVPNLKWDSSDSINAMLGRALTYLVLYSTLGMVVRSYSCPVSSAI